MPTEPEQILTYDKEYITISSCPLCGKIHLYPRETKPASVLIAASDFKTRIFTCPIAKEQFQIQSLSIGASDLSLSQSMPISPYSEAIYEAGKILLTESMNTGRDFCKEMITLSTAAIPIYLAIIGFILPKDYHIEVSRMIFLILPAILYLAASIVFVVGFLPVKKDFSPDIVEEVEAVRKEVINRRKQLISSGFVIFSISTFMAIFAVGQSLALR